MPDTSVMVSPQTNQPSPAQGRGAEAGSITSSFGRHEIMSGNRVAPAIYYCDTQPTQKDINDAANLAFNAIGIPYFPINILQDLLPIAAEKNLKIAMDMDILSLGALGLEDEHPEWFTRSEEGPRFVFLSEFDPSVSWWDEHIAQLQAASVDAFRCLNLADVPHAVWTRLIANAKRRNPQTAFYAWTVGLAPAAVGSLGSCGFDFVFSSSCWWDFKSAWLDEEADRLATVAPVIALVAPPNAVWSALRSHRQRSLHLAAFYGAGWLMQAGFQNIGDEGLSDQIVQLNSLRHQHATALLATPARIISSTGSQVAILVRTDHLVLIVNSSNDMQSIFSVSTAAGKLPGRLSRISDEALGRDAVELAIAGSEILKVSRLSPVTVNAGFPPNCEAPRIAIESITPQVDDGGFPVRRIVGEHVSVEVDLIADGHDKIAAELIWRCLDEETWQTAPMTFLENDRWAGVFPLERLGRYVYAILSWKDIYATFVDELSKKFNAGISTKLEVEEGILLLREAAEFGTGPERTMLGAVLALLDGQDEDEKRRMLLSGDIAEKMRAAAPRKFIRRSHDIIVDAERIGARFANWYEIFPRSQAGDGLRHGTFRDVIGQLPRVAAMGFDVLYFPPIHPIGRINRKGKNNTLTPSDTDPGSPYAIGSPDGGHDAIHPELGDFDDFSALVREAAHFGIEIALDFAIQCAPDHPWLSEHRDWFDWRPDGSLRYAENPPKKYEDIVNVDFYTEGAKPSLWLALRDVVQFWVDQGVRLFRVDNPHTKPLPFWEWMINDIRSRHPDVIFLAEAFTRPKVMYRLAKIGFSQSYTYFTWRNTKVELTDYLTELNETAPKDFFRPHFFVNTPDINPIFLQNSGRAGFLIRAALAATLSGLWGVYNGFELCEGLAVAPGKEEYLNSEKYQLRAWDYDRPGNIVAEISKLNAARRCNAALQSHLGVRFHQAFDDQVLFFSKMADDGNVILAAISLDPFGTHQFKIELPLWLFGLSDDGSLAATDLMRDFDFTWRGKIQDVTLHPGSPFCIWRIRPEGD